MGVIACIAVVYLLSGCKEKEPVKPIEVETITFDKSSLQLTLGESATLTPTILPADAADKTLVWQSDNVSVATVDKGAVTSVGVGSCKITATATNSVKAVCDVTVAAKPGQVDIYSVATLSAAIGKGTQTGAIYKNGELIYTVKYTDRSMYFSSVAVIGDDVYTSGHSSSSSAIITFATKNGAEYFRYPTTIGFTNPSKMIAVGNDLYTVGYDYDQTYLPIGHVWKNDKVHFTFNSPYPATPDLLPYALIEKDGVIYSAVSAYQEVSGAAVERPVIYKDTDIYLRLNIENSTAKANGLCEYKGDIYTCGAISTGETSRQGCVWKNADILYRLADVSINSSAKSIAVAPNGDIYVCGTLSDETDKGVVWKNGQLLYELVDSKYTMSDVSQIAFVNDVCYVCGTALVTSTGISHAALWCDGKLKYDLYDTTSSTPFGNMTAMTFVVK